MSRKIRLTGAVALSLVVLGAGGAFASSSERSANANPHAIYAPARGKAGPGAGGSPNLTWHGGPVMRTPAAVTSIYWGTSWNGYTGDKVSGLDSFYSGVGGTPYEATNTEYTDATGHVTTGVSFNGHLFDYSAAPRRAPSTSAILNEVAKLITNPVANGYYAVYVDTKRGHASYCAWHSNGTITVGTTGVPVQFAFFFNLDGDPGCDPQDSSTTHSQGLEALGNVTGHELSEALTDPKLNAWYDTSGAENADKCAWTFNKPVGIGGSNWKIQGNWSNAAYNANKGYARGGCIDGN